MRNIFNPALLALALSIGASVDARAIPNDQISHYQDKRSVSAGFGSLVSRASDLMLEARAPGIPGLGGLGKGEPKGPLTGGDHPPGTSTTGGEHPYDGQSPSTNPDGSTGGDHPYDGQTTGSKPDDGDTGTTHPYDGESGGSATICERAGDGSCNTNPSDPGDSWAAKLQAAGASSDKTDVQYSTLQAESYSVNSVSNNVVDENAWNLIYPDLAPKLQNDLGVDLHSADTIETTITRKPDGGSGDEAHFKFYTSSSQKTFCVESKFGSKDMTPSTGPLKMRTIQQQALEEGLSRSGGGVAPKDMEYFGELGITNTPTQKIIDDGRAGDTSENKVSFNSDSPTFAALSNSDNGRAEFGQLIDNMGSMGLTIDRVDTYSYQGIYMLFWHLTKA